MELFLLLIAIIGGVVWYQKSQTPNKQKANKAKLLIQYSNEADAAYKFLSEALDEMLKKDLPRWVKEAEENLKNWQRDAPTVKPPNDLTYQPDKQAARKKEIKAEIAKLKKVRDKFMRILIRHEHSEDIDMRLQIVYDFYQYVNQKANIYNYRGIENMFYANEAEQKAWEIKFEEIEKRFDKLLTE